MLLYNNIVVNYNNYLPVNEINLLYPPSVNIIYNICVQDIIIDMLR